MLCRIGVMLIFLLACFVCANLSLGIEETASWDDLLKKTFQETVMAQQVPGKTAENGATTVQGNGEDEHITSKLDGEKSGYSDKTKAPTLKEFVPSEQIEADQAVDFPTDI